MPKSFSHKELVSRYEAINRSNAMIEFTLDGYIVKVNDLFLQVMGYTQDEVIGKHHKIFVDDKYEVSDDYRKFWENLKRGEIFSDRIERIKKDGTIVYLQATYNPVINENGEVNRVLKIATDISEKIYQQKEIERKNTYLEHAAKIIRHDMHSGINTYIPRGISSLERRLSPEKIEELKIEAPLKMIKEGLKHTQKVYKGVYEFTNLVKKESVLNKENVNLVNILEDYLSSTSYRNQVILESLGEWSVNEALFCTAVDNLIRNGLKYNDSDTKYVKVRREDNCIFIEDNGRGLDSAEFIHLSQPYTRKEGQKESGTGLGLNICIAILEEHGFSITCKKREEGGSQLKITLR